MLINKTEKIILTQHNSQTCINQAIKNIASTRTRHLKCDHIENQKFSFVKQLIYIHVPNSEKRNEYLVSINKE